MPDTDTDLKPVYGEPELQPGWDDDGEPLNETDCGWDLTWGCNLSFGHADPSAEGGPLDVTVNTSDRHQGITVRSVTAEQLVAFGQMLVNLGATSIATEWLCRRPVCECRPAVDMVENVITATQAAHALRTPGYPGRQILSRTVTELPDGSTLTSSWKEVARNVKD